MSKNVVWQQRKVSYQNRCDLLKQKGLVVWFTGFSGSGKSTIAVEVEKKLYEKKRAVYMLDGDNIRHGINSDLGFSKEDRDENIRRIAEIAALFQDAGLITLVSFISPFRSMRDFARQRAGKGNFIEVYVSTDLETCKKRDPKGLYQKDISQMTGISSPYEPPEHPELQLDTIHYSAEECANLVVDKIIEYCVSTE